MSRFRRNIIEEMPQQPIVVVASLLCLGVALGWWVQLDWSVSLVVLAVLLLVFVLSPRWWSATLVLLSSGAALTSIHHNSVEGLAGEGYYNIEVLSEENGDRRGVLEVEGRADSVSHCRGEVLYKLSDSVELRRGDRVVAWCRIWEFRGRYYTNLSGRSIINIESRDEALERSWAERANEWLSSRIDQLRLKSESSAVVKAMLLGRREELSSDLYEEYQYSGAAHLLAVSGLHVMIIYFLVSRLTCLLHLLPLGFRLRAPLSAVVVWGYAMIVGMTPSVERAAIMFCLMQLLSLFGRRYFSMSGLALAVLIIVVSDVSVVFDVGFLLSVVAVLSILLWVLPLSRRYERWCSGFYGRKSVVGWFVKWLGVTLLIGVCCSFATLPIVSYVFGYVSPMGVLLSPLVTTTTYFLLLLSVLWSLLGLPLFAPLFRFVINILAELQNGAVDYMSSGWRDAVDVRLPLWVVWAIYVLYIVATVVVYGWREEKNKLQ